MYPSVNEITKQIKTTPNRYTVAIAAAKAARIITEEYTKQREKAEKEAVPRDEKSKSAAIAASIAANVKKEYRDDKAVKLAVNGLLNGEFKILTDEEAEAKRIREAEAEAKRIAEEEARKAEEAAKAAEEAAAAVDEDEELEMDADADSDAEAEDIDESADDEDTLDD